MQKEYSIIFLLVCSLVYSQSNFLTVFEKGNGNQSATYAEMMRFYQDLDQKFSNISLIPMGKDDNGEPITVVVFQPQNFKTTLLINNGIHPGEPDGIDATMMLMRDLATGKIKVSKNIRVAAIACYNVSGMLKRGKYSRANQNGPEEYGFRGTVRNFDLNRDFIKTDTKNSVAFQEIFHAFQPDYFIDNHVSNGADYQYIFTYISTNKERLGKVSGDYLHEKMQPEILKHLDKKQILHAPYVNIHGDVPDKGFSAFMDSPRYATGYTSLFNCLGTVPETHMLKNYKVRTWATYEYMVGSLHFVDKNFAEIQALTKKNLLQYQLQQKYALHWKVDSTKYKMIDFKGYEAGYKPSEVSGKPRLFYDRQKPFTKLVKFFDSYSASKEISIPRYYVIPKSEYKIIDALQRNKIKMQSLEKDSLIEVEQYRIEDYKTTKNPYEGHYLHYDTKVQKSNTKIQYKKGDFVVSTLQNGVKYLLETLEPEAIDSFFNWNYMDGILGQKEYFSDYVFEDTAAQLLKSDEKLKKAFEQKKADDKTFRENASMQLDWVYRNSVYFEPSKNVYPIGRVL